jgi:hypothetical protein
MVWGVLVIDLDSYNDTNDLSKKVTDELFSSTGEYF